MRKLIVALLAGVLSLALLAPARAEINLHNGYIEIVDHVTYMTRKPLEGRRVDEGARPLNWQVMVQGQGLFHPSVTQGVVGHAIYNYCCILAGTDYKVKGATATAKPHVGFDEIFKPRLCNVRGIPFGYLKLEIVGVITRVEGEGRIESSGVALHRIDTGCPG